MNSVDNLAKYGKSFQAKVISALLTDNKTLDTLAEITTTDFFESDANKWLVEEILDYHNIYKKPPSIDVFKVKVSQIDNPILKKLVIDQLKVIYTQIGKIDLDYIKDEFTSFCINQNLKGVILKSVDLLKAGEYDKIKNLVDNAMKVGISLDLGLDYINDFDLRMEDDDRSTMPTSWKTINDLMDGGLSGGELGVVVAGAGAGKTWILTHIGAEAVRLGKSVVHYTMELSEHYVGARYDTIFTGIPTTELKEKQQQVKEKISTLKGRLLIKYFPPKGITTKKLGMHIEKLIADGNKPDLIIVDYADLLLSSTRHDSTYAEQGGVYIELRGLGGELDTPIWTASQANRCFCVNTPVETDQGRVKIGDLKIDTPILTHKGYKKVTNIFPKETQPVYKITLKSGKTVQCSLNHQFPVKYGKLKSIESGLKVGDQLFTKK